MEKLNHHPMRHGLLYGLWGRNDIELLPFSVRV
jgi:hypothetical protein